MVNGEKEGQQREDVGRVKDVRVPLGTMFVVLVYGLITIVMWGYMYYILLKADGYLGGF